ncbi:MAG: phage baseplate protein [Eubacteriales bacterium]|jgi:hypothetical protein
MGSIAGIINSLNPAAVTNAINNAVDNYIVRPILGRSALSGIAGFKFRILGDEEETLETEITDNWLEDNTAIQDHAAMRPERYTVKGYMGEVYHDGESTLDQALSVLSAFANLSGLSPAFSTKATQAIANISSTYNKINNVLDKAQSIYDIFTGRDTAETEQQKAYNWFVGLRNSRTLCSVQTPWNLYSSMMIERLGILQRDDNKYVSEFAITFKKVNIIGNTPGTTAAGRAAHMGASFVQKGLTAGTAVTSIASTLKAGW